MRQFERFDIGDVIDSAVLAVPAAKAPEGASKMVMAMRQYVDKGYELRLDKMSSGHVRLHKDGTLVTDPVATANLVSAVAQRDEAVFEQLFATLVDWGFGETTPLTMEEQQTAEESMYSCPDPERASTLTALLFAAQMPFASCLFNRMDDGFYRGLAAETMFMETPDFWHAPDLDALVITAFGFRRKDLVKLVATSPPHLTNWMAMVAPYLTEDQIIRAFRELASGNYHPVPGMTVNIVDTVFTSLTHPTSRYNLAINRDGWQQDMYFENGDFSMSGPGVEKLFSHRKIRGWGEVAREAMFEYARSSDTLAVVQDDWVHGLRDKTVGRFVIQPMLTAYDLLKTGDGLSVCVGRIDYLRRILCGDSVIVRLDSSDGMEALADLRRDRDGHLEIAEVKGHGNLLPPEDLDTQELLDLIRSAAQHNTSNHERRHDGYLPTEYLAA